jgi:YesN/AraC family two-component response regulator
MPIVVSTLLFLIVYSGLRHQFLFTIKSITKEEFMTYNNEKYKTSNLSKRDSKIIFQKLVQLMRSEKYYLKEDLSLSQLADLTEIPYRDLSQIINENADLNFYNFINQYRVDEAKRLLLQISNNNRTILDICFEVGFNTKATFNAAFKKFTNKTPSQFINENS